jgi:hypothetical protein
MAYWFVAKPDSHPAEPNRQSAGSVRAVFGGCSYPLASEPLRAKARSGFQKVVDYYDKQVL